VREVFETAVGMAHCAFAERLVVEDPDLVDFIEIPFEQLVHNPGSADIGAHIPLILHCASLSIAGNAAADQRILDAVAHWARQTKTPWIGEHLSYIRSDALWKELAEHPALFIADPGISDIADTPFNVGYTVSPQYSEPLVDRVCAAWSRYQDRLGTTILLENGPIYFAMPGSTLSQSEFIARLCARDESVRLLLDLAHLFITSKNTGRDVHSLLDAFPAERVIEVHISGTQTEAGMCWDDHGSGAPDICFSLLERLLERVKPKAVTLEYNWSSDFPRDILKRDVGRVRDLLGKSQWT
jgi:uncharacterized protein (UPF0276 family)